MRHVARVVVPVALVFLFAACSSSSHPAATPTTPVPTSRASGTTASPPPAPASTASTTTVAGPSGCTSDEVAVTLGPADGAAGHSFRAIIFTNATVRATCTLVGYPGVSFVTAAGRQLGAEADRRPNGDPPVVTLGPGRQAFATLIETATGIQAGCRPPRHTAPAARLRVYAPNNSRPALGIRWHAEVCSAPSVHQLAVTAVGLPL